MPKVSVIIPVYNVEKYLAECLNSICRQTLRSIEIICVNDGSTDGSAKILAEYKRKDKRFRVITQENRGLSTARNIGIRQAQGDYIYFMDGDDILELNALNILWQKSQVNNLDILYFDGRVIFEDKRTAKRQKWYKGFYVRQKEYSEVTSGQELFVKMKINGEYRHSQCLQFIRKAYLKRLKLFYHEGIYHEDVAFNLQAMLQAERVSHIKKKFFIRRVRANSIITQKINYKHFYGRFSGYIDMLNFIIVNNIREPLVFSELTEGLSAAISAYDLLTRIEKKKINTFLPLERYLFDTLICDEHKFKRFFVWFLQKIKDIIRSWLN
jgi:glycosyltransferase involved in cell wall biosynthesis